MKKIKLGKLDVQALSERDLKNVLGGVGSPTSTVSTNSSGGSTQSAKKYDADTEETDSDFNAIERIGN